jgi:hypothetical protein
MFTVTKAIKTLAYYTTELSTTLKIFIVFSPGLIFNMDSCGKQDILAGIPTPFKGVNE